jgi:hypothetical protein
MLRGGMSHGQRDPDFAHRDAHPPPDLEQPQPDGLALRLGHLGARQTQPLQASEENYSRIWLERIRPVPARWIAHRQGSR